MITGFQAGVMGTYGKPWTPANITTALWLDAADATTITQTDGSVSQWADKSGNSRHATSTGTAMPLSNVRTLNSQSVLVFDGSDDYLVCPVFDLDCPTSLFIVFSYDLLTGYPTLINQQYTSVDAEAIRPWQHYVSTTYGLLDWRFSCRTGLFSANSAQFVSEIQDAKNSVQIWLNGNPGTNSTIAGNYATSSQAINIGKRQADGELNWFDGYIGEIVLVKSAVTTLARQKIEGYLAHKWGLTASLPSDHPYRYSPPTV